MQKQKRCPAVRTTPARCHWVTVKPYSKVYLSSLKGSALTLGVSIDLGNTVPSAPEITKQNRRQIVNIISCYQGSDFQIMPRCNLTHRLTPFLSCTHPFSPQERPDLDHLKLVALIITGICLQAAFLDVKAAACTLTVGSVCQTSWCNELGKDTPLVTRHLIQLHPSLMNLDACHGIISFPGLWEIPKGDIQILSQSLPVSLWSGCTSAWGKGGRCPPEEMQHKQALVPAQNVWPRSYLTFAKFSLLLRGRGEGSTILICWLLLQSWAVNCDVNKQLS